VITYLGVGQETDAIYELQGFDGSVSSARAVSVDLVFATKTFRGKYLTVDQLYGILGRDVLNRQQLILDGPQQTWEAR
jgi:hypothetical protein